MSRVGDVDGGHRRFERDGEKVEAVLTGDVAEQRRWFPGDEGDGGDLALAELLERHLLIVVGGRHRDIQKIEEPACRDRGAGAPQIDVHLLVCQLCDAFNVAPSEQMELLVIELGDISDPAFEAGEIVLLARVIENIGLQDGHVDPAQ